MEQQRILETLQAAVAYQLLGIGCDNNDAGLWHPGMARCLKRMIDEPDYRAVVLDTWSEVFEQRNGEMFEALRDILGGTQLWEDLVKASQSASATADTQRISKN